MATKKISPEKPQFFKPFLPGFEQGIDIPKDFLEYLKIDQYECATLRRADKKWRVKVNGNRLEGGWEKFAEQHDLQVGNMLVFRHEGDMEFEVFIFDFNHCEREYEEEQQKTQNVEETSKKYKKEQQKTQNVEETSKKYEKEQKTQNIEETSKNYEEEQQKTQNVEETSKKYEEEQQKTQNVEETSKKYEEQKTQNVEETSKNYEEEQQKIQNIEETSKKFESKEAATQEPLGRSYFVCILQPYCFSRDSLSIPRKFALANGLFDIKEHNLIVIDERQRSWNAIIRAYPNSVYLKSGWNNIRDANRLKKGDRIMFKIVTDGNKPIWKLHSKISQDIQEDE